MIFTIWDPFYMIYSLLKMFESTLLLKYNILLYHLEP